jgi:hypothetical protein
LTSPLAPTPRFGYGKPDAHCDFCGRTENPHPDFDETIPTALFTSASGRAVELCLSCYEQERDAVSGTSTSLAQRLDERMSAKDIIGASLKSNDGTLS